MIIDKNDENLMKIVEEDGVYLIHCGQTVIKDKKTLKFLRMRKNLLDAQKKGTIEPEEFDELMNEVIPELVKSVKNMYSLTSD